MRILQQLLIKLPIFYKGIYKVYIIHHYGFGQSTFNANYLWLRYGTAIDLEDYKNGID